MKLQVDIGANQQLRQVISGIMDFYREDELTNRLVVAVTNLKPKSLKGEKSEAMLLAGSQGKDTVKLLDPPSACEPGDRVHLTGASTSKPPPERCNPNNWEAITAQLKVQDGKASYKNIVLTTNKGDITVSSLENGRSIH